LAKTLRALAKEIFLPIFFSLLVGLFWLMKPLGPGPLNGFFALVLLSGSLFWYIRRRSESIEFLVFLSVFLTFFILHNFQLAFALPFWLMELLSSLFSFLVITYLCYEKNLKEKIVWFGLGLAIGIAQLFVVLSFLPFNLLTKSALLSLIVYTFWHIVVKKGYYLKFLILVCVVIVLILSTASWSAV